MGAYRLTAWVHLQTGCSLHQALLGAVTKPQIVLSGPGSSSPARNEGASYIEWQVLRILHQHCKKKLPADEAPAVLAGMRAAVGLKALYCSGKLGEVPSSFFDCFSCKNSSWLKGNKIKMCKSYGFVPQLWTETEDSEQ